jgi:membrane protein DedA with SNARE-associated domain
MESVEPFLGWLQAHRFAVVLLARFSTSVRLFAAILAGTGHIRYQRFVVLDLVGTIGSTAVRIGLGFLFGEIVLDRAGPYRRALLPVPTTLVAILGYRLLRRWRYGAASHGRFPPR